MSVLKRRSRMISFRVSEDEYAGLKNLCVNEGARSVSDMARDAVHRLITNHSYPNNQTWPNQARPNHQLETVVQVLQGRIEALDLEVKRLGKALNGQSPTRSNNSGIALRNGNGDI
jgi:hypothetical protein